MSVAERRRARVPLSQVQAAHVARAMPRALPTRLYGAEHAGARMDALAVHYDADEWDAWCAVRPQPRRIPRTVSLCGASAHASAAPGRLAACC